VKRAFEHFLPKSNMVLLSSTENKMIIKKVRE